MFNVLLSVAGGVIVPQLSRHISCESVDSMNSQSSANSLSSHQSAMMYGDKKKQKKKNWVTLLMFFGEYYDMP